jgi:hypothetical protein
MRIIKPLAGGLIVSAAIGLWDNSTVQAQVRPDRRDDVSVDRSNDNGVRQVNRRRDSWRYKRHNGEWWYWSPSDRWLYWRDGSWHAYVPGRFSPVPSYRYRNPGYYGNWYYRNYGRPYTRYYGGDPYDYGYGGYRQYRYGPYIYDRRYRDPDFRRGAAIGGAVGDVIGGGWGAQLGAEIGGEIGRD